jgi:hypothetical protein
MKTILVLIASLFFSVLANAECTAVSPVNPQPSFKNVSIIAFVSGKPVQAATVAILLVGKELFSLRTDDHGVVTFPPLQPGFYSLVATSGDNLRSEMFLHVSDSEDKTSTFAMDLVAPQFPAKEQVLAATRRMPVSVRIQALKGIVQDQSGAAVAGAVVQVFPKEFGEKLATIELKTDENGKFSPPLGDGTYVVLVESQGFKIGAVIFEIARNGEAKPLQVTLQILAC